MRDRASLRGDVAVRPYREVDEPEVLDLLRLCLGPGPGGERTPEYFRWKHLENPFGRSFMIVAESEGQIVGFRALMRWRFRVGDRAIEAVRPVDTCTHPDHRGQGVFSMLTRRALESLKDEVDLVFNTPNPNSLPGYLKMGWQIVGEVPVSVRISRPARFLLAKLRRGASRPTASHPPPIAAPGALQILGDGAAVDSLIETSERPGWGYSTERSVEYLRWRYGEAPLLGYHAALEERAGRLRGIAFFRLRPQGTLWGLSVGDVIVGSGDVATARRLLRAARRAADVAYVAMTFPPGSTAARARRGPTTLRAPRGMVFVVNALHPDLSPDPTVLSSWALSTGDVEVF